jgi:hypothetical protein
MEFQRRSILHTLLLVWKWVLGFAACALVISAVARLAYQFIIFVGR